MRVGYDAGNRRPRPGRLASWTLRCRGNGSSAENEKNSGENDGDSRSHARASRPMNAGTSHRNSFGVHRAVVQERKRLD
jgi:hypothetical protein